MASGYVTCAGKGHSSDGKKAKVVKYAEGGKVKSAIEKAREQQQQADTDLETVRKKAKNVRWTGSFKKGGKVKKGY